MKIEINEHGRRWTTRAITALGVDPDAKPIMPALISALHDRRYRVVRAVCVAETVTLEVESLEPSKRYTWLVEITLDEQLVIDGVKIDEQILRNMISGALPLAYDHEFSGRVISAPGLARGTRVTVPDPADSYGYELADVQVDTTPRGPALSLLTVDTDAATVRVYTRRAHEEGLSLEGIERLLLDAADLAMALSRTGVAFSVERR